MTSEAPSRFGKYFTIAVFYIALFIRAMILISPVLLLYYQENGLTVKELFFFQGIFYLVSILIELPVGYIADCFSKKKVLIASFTFFLIANALWYFYEGYWIILIGEILYAFSKVSMDIANSGYLYDYLSSYNLQHEMPKYLGYLNFFLAGGTAFVGLIGAYLYSTFGSSTVLGTEVILLIFAIGLLFMLKNIPSAKKDKIKLSERYHDFAKGIQFVWRNVRIKNYIMYSGLLTSLSILFALSFQPLMQKAAFPVFLFGVIACTNHGLRAAFSALAGKLSLNIYKMRIPLFIAYFLSFIAIFILCFSSSIPLSLTLIVGICFVIGFQLLFTILHVARLHKYVDSTCRGMSMSVNNVIPKILTVVVLLSSRLFMNNIEMWKFYSYYFIVFIIFGVVLLYRTRNIRE